MKKVIILFSLVGLMLVVSLPNLSAGIAFSQTVTDTVALDVQAVQQAESVTTSDLGVSNPGLLPTNPFYFFKEFSRNVQRVFTFNPVAKAQLEVRIANEKVAEAKKIQEIVPNDNNAIAKGVVNYQAAQERVRSSLESLQTTASTTPEFEILMNSVATDVVSHQKVLDEIGSKASDSADVKNAVDSAKLKIDESAATAIQDNPTDFANKLQNALIDSKGSELKHMRSLEIITNIEARVPEAAKPALLKVQENLTNKLNESIQQATNISGSAAVQQLIKEIPSSDSAQRAATVKQLPSKVFVPSVKSGGEVGSTSVVSVCDTLKQSLEQLALNLKSGGLTEEQYKLKYDAIKKELEQCINKQQPQSTTTAIKKTEPVSNCEFLKKYPSDLDAMLKKGEISEKDYSVKLETIKKELEKCSAQSAPIEVSKPAAQVYCTQEAKLCSDGSYVGRTGPNCEFNKCPGESGGGSSNSMVFSFGGAYWQCYDGAEFKDSSSCKTSEEWKIEAKKFCEGHCYADKSKCGVNSFSVLGECGVVSPTSSASSGSAVAVKEECGKEKERVNRDPLAGPVTKQCCYGLKEDRSNKSYSICYKPEENIGDTTTSVSVVDSSPVGIANPASVYCVKQGFKSEILTNADGSQYGVCIFNDGSKCEEWAYYKGDCKLGVLVSPILSTTGSSSGGGSSAVLSIIPGSISVSVGAPQIFIKGDTVDVIAVVKDIYGNPLSNQTVMFQNGNSSAVAVTNTAGTAKVKYTSDYNAYTGLFKETDIVAKVLIPSTTDTFISNGTKVNAPYMSSIPQQGHLE